MEPILARLPADRTSREAECAVMLIAVARMMLDADPRSFAGWLRDIADDLEREADALDVPPAG